MIAVIDIGTVTVRLAVAEVAGGRVLRMAKHSEICNLGVGVDATGLLDTDAIKRVYMTVASYVEAAKNPAHRPSCARLPRPRAMQKMHPTLVWLSLLWALSP